MDWVKDFYRLQGQWTGIYSGEIQSHDGKKSALVRDTVGSQARTLLELGCGGGQFAGAAAQTNFDVYAVDIVHEALVNARRLADKVSPGTITCIEGDFFKLEFNRKFDVICYWDGFGIGEDDDQKHLLQQIDAWLKADGTAFIEVYTPWYWPKADGRKMDFGTAIRVYKYDHEGQRMMDDWWRHDDPDFHISQSLRCYTPDELKGLLRDTDLEIHSLHPGGSYDYDRNVYHEVVPLEQAMQYTAVLRRTSPVIP